MTAHAVPVAAAESAAPNATSPTMPAQAITLRWESTNMVVPAISISGKQISVSAVIAPKKQTTKSRALHNINPPSTDWRSTPGKKGFVSTD